MDAAMDMRIMSKPLDDDTIIYILKYLVAPTDVANVSCVSRSWRQLVKEGQLWKGLCNRVFPELELIDEVVQIDSTTTQEVGPSVSSYLESLQKEHQFYHHLFRELTLPPDSKRSCISSAIAASTTDNFPSESIQHTLSPGPLAHQEPMVNGNWSYWSSIGQENADVPETLTYKLASSLCVVHEIKVRPFKAEFQRGFPVYSSKFMRFRLGFECMRDCNGVDSDQVDNENSYSQEYPCPSKPTPKYTWTYVSPTYPMEQVDKLQSFVLPRPVLCMGKILQIELLERVQAQEGDQLYYICVCDVRVIGRPLLNYDFSHSSRHGGYALIYFKRPGAQDLPSATKALKILSKEEFSGRNGARDHFAERIRQLRLNRGLYCNSFLNRLLGNIGIARLLLAAEDYNTDKEDGHTEDEQDEDEFGEESDTAYLF